MDNTLINILVLILLWA